MSIVGLLSPDYPSVSANPLQQPGPAPPLPSSRYTCPPLPPGCTSLDKAKRLGQLSHLHLVPQDALLYRAKCNRAAREGKYSEKMEVAEPALVAAEGLHSHLGSQD